MKLLTHTVDRSFGWCRVGRSRWLLNAARSFSSQPGGTERRIRIQRNQPRRPETLEPNRWSGNTPNNVVRRGGALRPLVPAPQEENQEKTSMLPSLLPGSHSDFSAPRLGVTRGGGGVLWIPNHESDGVFRQDPGGGSVRGREHEGARAHPAGCHEVQEGDRQGEFRDSFSFLETIKMLQQHGANKTSRECCWCFMFFFCAARYEPHTHTLTHTLARALSSSFFKERHTAIVALLSAGAPELPPGFSPRLHSGGAPGAQLYTHTTQSCAQLLAARFEVAS